MDNNSLLIRNTCTLCGEGHFSPEVEQRAVNSNVRAFKSEIFRVWRCPSCHSIHSLDIIDTAPYFKDYPLSRRPFSFRTAVYFNQLLSQLRRAGMRKTSSLLDHGCVEGDLVHFLKCKGYNDCWAYDPLLPNQDPTALNRTYDVVVCNDTLEFVEDPATYLKHLADLTAPGGILLIETEEATRINMKDPSSQLPHLMHQPYHRHILSEKMLRQLAAGAGLHAVSALRRSYTDSYWPTANWKFISEYLNSIDNTVDAALEPPRVFNVLRSPKLLFYAIFGRFFDNNPAEIMMVFKKPSLEAERFTALDFALSIGSSVLLCALSALSIIALLTPLTKQLLGEFHIIVDLGAIMLLYGLLSGLLQHLVLKFFPIECGTHSFASPTYLRWKYITMMFFTANAFLFPLVPIALQPLRLMLFGAKIGKDAAIGGIIDTPYLFTMGEGSTIGANSIVTCSMSLKDKIIIGKITIGNNVTIGMNAVIMTDVEIGDGAVVEIGSVVMPGSRIPPGERWRGNPARKWV